MTDIRLFDVQNGKAQEINKTGIDLEKNIQTLIENNLEEFFSIRFLATEYSTGKKHKGRIDSLGIDENNSPVIIEYKRQMNENIINQGLFYFDWLLDHKANFEMLVMDKLGNDIDVDWSSPRLLCIAEDFTRYDSYAVEQMNRNIELIRYQIYTGDYILFELTNVAEGDKSTSKNKRDYKGFEHYYKVANQKIKDLFQEMEDYIMSLGDDVQKKELKYYVAYKRLRNFACVEVKKNKILIYLKLNPDKLDSIPELGRNVSNIGHYGTGDLELTIKNLEDLELIKSLINKSYNES